MTNARMTDLIRRLRRYSLSLLVDAALATSGFLLADVLRLGTTIAWAHILTSALVLFSLSMGANYYFGVHRRMWRYASIPDITVVAGAILTTTVLFSAIDLAIRPLDRPFWVSTVPEGAVLAFSILVAYKLLPRLRAMRARAQARAADDTSPRALVVGAGEAGVLLARDFQINRITHFQVVGFVDDDPSKQHMHLHGVEVLGNRHDIPRLVREQEIDLIAIAIPTSTRDQLDELVALCQGTGARVRIVPSLSEIATRPNSAATLRDLDISDLLGREEVRLDVDACVNYVQARVVLVTGAAGSIGSELCRQLVHLNPSRLVVLDTNETGLFDLHAELTSMGVRCEIEVCIADITNEDRVTRIFREQQPAVVFHAAAYKHVPLLQQHPAEAVRANVLGTAILCRAAHLNGVDRFVFISSDKAVEAANNLGYSKRVGELLVRAFGRESRTTFCAVRFGNVIGSRGSVVPTFERQIAAGGPVTVTHPNVTRFFMSIPEAACLVVQAAANAASGSIFMLDMGQPVSIVSLAEKMVRLRGYRVGRDVEIVFTGLRPGEKMHEELTTSLEQTRPTGHSKIMEVVDSQPVSRLQLESAVSALVQLTRVASDLQLSAALRMIARGDGASALPRPAAEARREQAVADLPQTGSHAVDPLPLFSASLLKRPQIERQPVGATASDPAPIVEFAPRWRSRHPEQALTAQLDGERKEQRAAREPP